METLIKNIFSDKSRSYLIKYGSTTGEKKLIGNLTSEWSKNFHKNIDFFVKDCSSELFNLPYYPLCEIFHQYLDKNKITRDNIERIIEFKNEDLLHILPDISSFLFYENDIKNNFQQEYSISFDQNRLQLNFMEKIFLFFDNIVTEFNRVIIILRNIDEAPVSTLNLLKYFLRSIKNKEILFVMTLPEDYKEKKNSQNNEFIESLIAKNKYEELFEEISLSDLSDNMEFSDDTSLVDSSGGSENINNYYESNRALCTFQEISSHFDDKQLSKVFKILPDILIIYYNFFDFNGAISFLKKLISKVDESSKSSVKKKKSDLFKYLLYFYKLSSRKIEFEQFLNEALMFFKQQNDNLFVAHVYKFLGFLNQVKQTYLDANKNLYKSFEIYKSLNTSEFFPEILFLLTMTRYSIGDYDHGLYFDECERYCKDLDNNFILAKLYLHEVFICSLELDLVSPESGKDYLMKAYNLAKDEDNDYLLSEVWIHNGHLQKTLRNFKSSVSYYEKGIESKKIIGDIDAVFQAYNSLGYTYFLRGEWDKSIKSYQNALLYASKTGDLMELSLTYLNLGDAYYQLGNADNALTNYEKALLLKKDIPNIEVINGIHGLPKIYNSIALAMIKKGDLLQAEEYIRLSEKYFLSSRFHVESCKILYGKALLKKEAGDYDAAIALMDSAVEKCYWDFYRGYLLAEMGIMYRIQGKALEADECFDKAIEVYCNGNNTAYEMKVKKLKENKDAVYDFLFSDIKATTFEEDNIIKKFEQSNFETLTLYNKIIQQKNELKEANNKLKEWDKLKSEFFSNVSHDFRSPLTVILNKADLALRTDSGMSDSCRKSFSVIYDASIKLTGTIDKLLDVARMDSRGVELNVAKVDLKKFLKDIISFYREAVSDSNIEIIDNLQGEEIEGFYSDIDKLDEIINNILSNAIKFVDSEKGKVTLEVEETNDKVTILIKDNGIGIAREELNTIFKRYEQINNSSNFFYKGSGIGLAFAKQLTESLKGRVWADSEGVGSGALFYLEFSKGKDVFDLEDFAGTNLPIFRNNNKQSKIQSDLKEKLQYSDSGIMEQLTDLSNENHDYRKGLILIVDDSEYIRDIVKSYLESDGYSNFIMASDGKSGLEAVYRYTPDFIISDYNLPLMKGDQLHDEILNHPDFKNIPLIFLSAVANEEFINLRKRKGAAAYLKKPIDVEDLLLNVEVHMKKYMDFKKIRQLITIDELTNLYKKNIIVDMLNKEVSIRRFRDLSLIMFNINDFKSFNDSYGWKTGDMVLSRVAEILTGHIRQYDMAGRYGGDDFLVLLPDTDVIKAKTVAEKLRYEIEKTKLSYGDVDISITASFGVASLRDNAFYLETELGIDNLELLYSEYFDGEIYDMKNIQSKKNIIADILLSIVEKAHLTANISACQSCGYSSEEISLFKDDRCPQCNSHDLLMGKNRVVVFDNESYIQ